MVLVVLWLLGYGYKVAGHAIHLLLVGVAMLFMSLIFRIFWPSSQARLHLQKTAGELMQGKIRWLNPGKQWGLIERKNGRDVFFQCSSFELPEREALYEGEKVEFAVEESTVPVAKHVVRVKVTAAA
jgi:cold shock CspA family protein